MHRAYHHDRMTFGLLYAFTENFVLPLSHDEVVHGKGSLLGKMPGDRWQKFANLRAYLGFMYGHPGKKLLFMGGEFAQEREWTHDESLDWHLLADPMHAGVQSLVRDLNRLYRTQPALHAHDCDGARLCLDRLQRSRQQRLARSCAKARRRTISSSVVCNFTPVPRLGYRLGVPLPGLYRELPEHRRRPLRRQQSRQRRRHRGGGGALARPALFAAPDPAAAWRRLLLRPGRPPHERTPASVSNREARYPLACATWDGKGVNFALFSANAEQGRALLFRSWPAGASSNAWCCPNTPTTSGTAICRAARPGMLYGYRVLRAVRAQSRPSLQP